MYPLVDGASQLLDGHNVLAIPPWTRPATPARCPTELGFDVDATVPTVAFSAPAADPSVGKTVTFTFKASEGGVSHGCRLDGEAMHACIGGRPAARPSRRWPTEA
jgi:hypothetical protein